MIATYLAPLKYVVVSLFCLAALFPYAAFAALEVTFEAAPLFINANVMPGDAVTRSVVVSNTGNEPEDIIFSLENTFSDGLADVMEVAVVSGTDLYADTTFTQLFAWGEVDLGVLPAQSTKTYEFTAFLDPAVGNAYQLSELGFDLVIGFSGGETVTDNPGSGGGGGGGRGGSTRDEFDLFNEAVTVEDNIVAQLTWSTNREATSFAVCGDIDDGPFALDADDALFGYSFGSTEDKTKTLTHAVNFADLDAGTYACRVASREDTDDAFTVGKEVEFVILPGGLVAGITDSQPFVGGNILQPTPLVAGASTWGKGSQMTYEEYRAELDAMKVARDEFESGSLSRGTSTTELQPIDNLPTGIDAADMNQASPRYWIFVLIGLVALGFAWVLARLRRVSNN
jgi:hypothetical protein